MQRFHRFQSRALRPEAARDADIAITCNEARAETHLPVDRGDAPDNPEHGQEAAHLMRLQCGEGSVQISERLCPTFARHQS